MFPWQPDFDKHVFKKNLKFRFLMNKKNLIGVTFTILVIFSYYEIQNGGVLKPLPLLSSSFSREEHGAPT